ncbi:tetratricopeptide repeat protein [Fusobacterium pseudoperiodonticum]|jgi:hypothetical protein|uniref:Tetratricopeptide repeat protein n=3 Tax=Fusobacterium TaxID=848 RepID=A0AAD0HWQ0_9FUSO|nr:MULTISPECIES: hypothetical protein [Fusobacterium]ATV36828.1 hypothetical protein CTM64_13240 [Fusobacterium pseudoperiodonticum]ATV62644.1 hypothetical protein CTM74_12890 [Fusobacterium pseudoperiodonticum]AVQ25598.1 hypothetical protein C4N17_07805 [Fusobacterium periodonticum]KGE62056.1 hypothetical protein FSAG_001751 [Fusobacterium periodonticum 2_1_31]
MLKKLAITLVAIVFVGCYNLDNVGGKSSGGSIREIEIAGSQQTGGTTAPTPNTTTGETVETRPQQEEKIVSVDVNDENVNDYLTIIKSNLRTSAKKVDDNIKNQYTVPIGETLVFPVDNEKAIKLSTSPKNANPKVSLTNGKVTFRTVYQGQYVLSTYVNGSVNRKITVSAISKYDFNEKDLYKLILQDSEKRDKDVENAVTLYKMLYPAGRYSKEVNYLFLKYAYDIRNNSLINEALAGVKNDFSSYSDSEKATILRAAKLANKSIFIPSEVYNTNNSDLKNALNEYNNSSKAPVDRAPSAPVDNRTVTTEKNKTKTQTTENETSIVDYAREKVRSVVGGISGTTTTVTTVGSVKSKTTNTTESYYEKGMKNLNSNPKVAIDNLKKSLSSEKIQDKKPEIYYNIASSYAKLGNRVEVTKYIRLLKQEFPNSSWAKKSEALSNLIK